MTTPTQGTDTGMPPPSAVPVPESMPAGTPRPRPPRGQPKRMAALRARALESANPTGVRSLPGRIVRFGSVGASGAVVNLAVLAVLVHGLHWHPVWSALVSIEASTLWNHHWNRRWTWGDRAEGRTLARYHAVTGGAMAVQFVTVLVGTSLLGLPVLVAAAIGIALGTASNYLGNDRFSFAPRTAAVPASWRGRPRALAYAGVGLLLLVGAAVLWHPWDTYVMQESTQSFLVDGVTPYETAREAPDHIYPGATLPTVAQWYAYPPLPLLLLAATYWPVASGALASPAAARVLVKLPILLATLALPLVAGRFLARTPDASPVARSEAARLVERALLLNPLIILVAIVWGQFEAVALLALIGCLAALRHGRVGLAGGLWGTAVLVKILPVYLAPLLVVHLVRRFGTRATLRFFAIGGAVFGVVSLPFFLIEPLGFYQQVLGMHLGRPPARFAPVSAVYYLAKWATAGGLLQVPIDTVIDALSLGSFLLTITVILLVATAATRWPADEPALLWGAGITMLVALLATKVLNEQYLVLPIGLLALAAFHPHGATSPAAQRSCRRLLRWGPAAVVAASLIDNYHFLTFIAPDVLEALTGAGAATHTTNLAWSLGLSLLQLQLGLDLVVGAILLAVFVATVPTLRHVATDAATALAAVLPRRAFARTIRREVMLVHTLLLAIVFPVFAVGLAPNADSEPDAFALPRGEAPLLLALYTTSWDNPAQDPETRAGTWERALTTPTIGHYTVNAQRASQDIASMRAAGLHGIVITFEPRYERHAHSAVQAARAHGTPHALHVNVADADGRTPMTPAHLDDVARLLRGPGLAYWDGHGRLVVGDDQVPVLLVDGVPTIGYTFDDAELHYVTSVPGAPLPTDGVAPPAAPTTIQELFAPGPAATEWRALYRHAQTAWWAEALSRAGVPAGTLVIVAGVPIQPIHGTDATWVQRGVPDAAGFRVVRLGDGPLDVSKLALSWHAATATGADAILVPWNQHAESRAIEPTRDHGDAMLRATTGLASA